MSTWQEKYEEAERLRELSEEAAKDAHKQRIEELRKKPMLDRLVFAAYARCPCGAGLAYDPAEDLGLHGYWDCSAILLGTASVEVKHEAKLPFAFYEIKSEQQPSVRGATTRPKP